MEDNLTNNFTSLHFCYFVSLVKRVTIYEIHVKTMVQYRNIPFPKFQNSKHDFNQFMKYKELCSSPNGREPLCAWARVYNRASAS